MERTSSLESFCRTDHCNPKSEGTDNARLLSPPGMGPQGRRLKDDWERGGGTLGPIGEGGEGYRISTHIQDRSDEKRKPPRRLLKLFWFWFPTLPIWQFNFL